MKMSKNNNVEEIKPYNNVEDKTGQINRMFDSVAGAYDFFNHFFSLGIDKIWRKKTISAVVKGKPGNVLDLATGTGDMVVELYKQGVRDITGVDISRQMMIRAEKKTSGYTDLKVEYLVGNIENLAFDANSFDAVTIAFGIRNVSKISRGLEEMYRVVKPGHKVFILELSPPSNPVFRIFYYIYLKGVMPVVGRIFSKDRNAYRYLSESAATFPEPSRFSVMMARAGFKNVEITKMTGGIVVLFTGEK